LGLMFAFTEYEVGVRTGPAANADGTDETAADRRTTAKPIWNFMEHSLLFA